MNRRGLLVHAIVFIAAFSLKTAYLEERRTLPDFDFPSLDSKFHDDWATAIATGQWTGDIGTLRKEPYFRAPLYPYFMAGVYRLFGHDYAALLRVQVLIGALSTVLLFVFCDHVFGRRPAWISAALYLGYWPITYFEGERLIPVLTTFLNLALVISLVWAGSQRSARWWAAPGALLGLSAIARPNILITLPVIAWWVIRRTPGGRGGLSASLWLLIAAAVVIAPVTLRNAVVGRDPVVIASQGGVNFYIGNNAASDGIRAVVPGTPADWWGGYYGARRLAEDAAGHALRPSQVSNYYLWKGLNFIVKDPLSAFRLYGRKLVLLLGSPEVSNNEQLYFRRDRSMVLRKLPVTFGLLLALAALGAFAVIRGWIPPPSRLDGLLPLCLAAAYAVSVLLFFVTSRHRLPVAIWLVPLAAAGVDQLVASVAARRRRRVWVSGTVAIGIVVACSLNPLGVGELAAARGYYSLGVSYANTDIEKALDAFDRSVQADSSFAPAWRMRGWALDKAGRYPEAVSDLERACRLDSTDADAFYALGVVYQKLALHDAARRAYDHVLALDPVHARAINNIADIYMRSEQYERAKPYLARALEIDPELVNAQYGLGFYYEKTGNVSAAARVYRGIAHFPPARLRLVLIAANDGRFDEAEDMISEWATRFPGAADLPQLRQLIQQKRDTEADGP